MNVQQAMETDLMRRCRVCAGHAGLSRSILCIDNMEVPNIYPWLKEGELLITTGYVLQHQQQEIPHLLHALAEVNAAGLALKTSYIGEVSEELCQVADELKLPLIEIPPDIAFMDIIMPLMKRLIGERKAEVNAYQEIDRAFMHYELEGGGLENLAKTLAELLGEPVFILTPSMDIHICECVCSDETRAVPYTKLIKHWSRFEPSKASAAGSLILPYTLEYDGRKLLVQEVLLNKRLLGYVAVPDSKRAPDDSVLIALHRASTHAAIEISKLHAIKDTQRQVQINLLNDLVSSMIQSEAEAVSRANSAAFPTLPLSLFVLDVNNFPTFTHLPEEKILQLKNTIMEILHYFLAQRHIKAAILNNSDNFTGILSIQPSIEQMQTLMDGMAIMLRTKLNIQATVGGTHFCKNYIDIPECVRDAQDAIVICRALYPTQLAVCIEQVYPDKLILDGAQSGKIQAFADRLIGPLEQNDSGGQMMETLECYIKTSGVRSQTAKKMFVHRNTLNNRLARIETLLNCDLNNAQTLNNLDFCIKVRKLYAVLKD